MDANERRYKVRTAADWWGLLDGDDMTRAEREAFIDWLRDSQTNVAEMLRLIQVQADLKDLKLAHEWPDIDTDRRPGDGQGNVVPLPMVSISSKTTGEEKGRGIRLFALAATLAAISVVTALLIPHFRGQWIATDRGEHREVVLNDGSVVQLDEQTRLNIRFKQSRRQVILTRGRAVFRVAKNAQSPFLVEAGGTTVRAIGTAFGVDRRISDQVVVTVSEGKVAVSTTKIFPSHPNISTDSSPHKGEGGAQHRTKSDEGEVYLTANEQITVAMARAPQPVRAVDSQRELAWAERQLVFQNDTVATVIAAFNRYNRVQLEVADPQLAARPVSGVFDAYDPEDFIAFLQNAAPIHIKRYKGQSIVISPGASN